MHKIIAVMVLVKTLVVFSPSAIAAPDLLQDMVHLDQVYIPVLALTSEEKPGPSRVAMAALKPVWRDFRNNHEGRFATDGQWRSDLAKIEAHIAAADRVISRGSGLKQAHEELEHIRIVLMHARKRNGVDYYIDHLTRFHEPMEAIVLAVKGKTEQTLAVDDIAIVRQHLPEARRLWQATTSARFDAGLYQFNRNQARSLRALVASEQKALDYLERALSSGNKRGIIAGGVAIKPNFAKIFRAFGRFPAQKQDHK